MGGKANAFKAFVPLWDESFLILSDELIGLIINQLTGGKSNGKQ